MVEHHTRFEHYQDYLQTLTQALIEGLGDVLLAIVLYGSVARGTASTVSDIDLLIVQQQSSSSYYERLAPVLAIERALRDSETLHTLVQEDLCPYVSFLLLSKEEAQENRYIFLDMVEEAIILYEQDGFFTKRMAELGRRLQELGAKRVVLPDGAWYWDLKPDLIVGEVFEL
jgi:predicted nucleotidyltransferase